MQMRRTIDSIGEIQQLANGDLRFSRIASPFSDRVRYAVVEFEECTTNRRERTDSPETFCPAKDRPSALRRSAISIMLEDCVAILHYEQRDAALVLGIFGGARAIS